jgi:hypothetical protein
VAALIEAALMTPAGARAIDLAKKTGSVVGARSRRRDGDAADLKKALRADARRGREVQGAHAGPPEAVSLLHERREEGETRLKRIAYPNSCSTLKGSLRRPLVGQAFRPAS